MTDPRQPPDWLVAVLAALTEGHDPAAPPHWRRRVDAELDRLAGRVPFPVVYDWHARVLASVPGGDASRVGGLFRRALAGDEVGAHEWRDALRPALRELYRAAYPYAEARAVAHANAHAYATANGYGPDEVTEFAAHYADLSTGANAEAFADANAIANADALAGALAGADERAYAAAHPAALVRAYALAAANRSGAGAVPRVLRTAYTRLADTLTESLRAVSE